MCREQRGKQLVIQRETTSLKHGSKAENLLFGAMLADKA